MAPTPQEGQRKKGEAETFQAQVVAKGKVSNTAFILTCNDWPFFWLRQELTSSSQAQNFSRSSAASRGGAASNAGHSSAWKAGSTKSEEARSETQYPVRPGVPDCQYYLKTGKCTYGARCKFNHPERDERYRHLSHIQGRCP